MRCPARTRSVRAQVRGFSSHVEGQISVDACAREDWRLARQSEMVEDFSHDDALADECDQFASCSAVGALEDVDGKNSLEQLGPCRGGRVGAALGVGAVRSRTVDRRCTRRRTRARSRHDQVSIRRCGREDTVIGMLVRARSRNQGRKPFDKGQLRRNGRGPAADKVMAQHRQRLVGSRPAVPASGRPPIPDNFLPATRCGLVRWRQPAPIAWRRCSLSTTSSLQALACLISESPITPDGSFQMNLRTVWVVLVAATIASLAALAPGETGSGNAAAVCACNNNPLTGANVPHDTTVKVTIPPTGDPGEETDCGGQTTGYSGTAFGNQTIAHGKCKYVEYAFTCTQIEGGSWVCSVVSFTLEERDQVSPPDCP